jgi:zinc transporter 1
MHGVFLHILGDALGSVAVIISALVIWLATGWKDRQMIDPVASLLIAGFIAAATVPLVKSTCLILLQGTPQYVGVVQIKRRLMRIPDVDSIHELHVWQLNEGKVVASVHVRVRDPVGDGRVSEQRLRSLRRVVERVFCDGGVHSVTIQLEVWDPKRDGNVPLHACLGRCARRCEPDAKCCDPESPDAHKLSAEEYALVKEEKDGGMVLLMPEDADDDHAWKAGARVTGFFHAPPKPVLPSSTSSSSSAEHAHHDGHRH